MCFFEYTWKRSGRNGERRGVILTIYRTCVRVWPKRDFGYHCSNSLFSSLFTFVFKYFASQGFPTTPRIFYNFKIISFIAFGNTKAPIKKPRSLSVSTLNSNVFIKPDGAIKGTNCSIARAKKKGQPLRILSARNAINFPNAEHELRSLFFLFWKHPVSRRSSGKISSYPDNFPFDSHQSPNDLLLFLFTRIIKTIPSFSLSLSLSNY